MRYITYQLVKPCVLTGRPIPESERTCSERSSFDGPVDISSGVRHGISERKSHRDFSVLIRSCLMCVDNNMLKSVLLKYNILRMRFHLKYCYLVDNDILPVEFL